MNPLELSQFINENIVLDKNGMISDEFMYLMANHLHKIYAQSYNTWLMFAQIAMTRISACGMNMYIDLDEANCFIMSDVQQDQMCDFTDSIKSMNLNQACFDFLSKQGANLINCASTCSHIKDILFALIEDLNKKGEYKNILLDSNVSTFVLVTFAKSVLYENLPKTEVIDRIAKKNVWQMHTPFIMENWFFIDKTDFAKKIGIKGPFKKARLFLRVFC